jgi:hypothetical protein
MKELCRVRIVGVHGDNNVAGRGKLGRALSS